MGPYQQGKNRFRSTNVFLLFLVSSSWLSSLDVDAETYTGTSLDLPFVTRPMKGILNASLVAVDGILYYDRPGDPLTFVPWIGNKGNLTLQDTRSSGLVLTSISGRTSDSAEAFVSDYLNFNGRHVSVIIGPVEKDEDKQVSISLTFERDGEQYKVVLVEGPLVIEGWSGNTYYEKIHGNMSRLLELPEIFSSVDSSEYILKRVEIIAQSLADIGTFSFDIYLGKLTDNLPALTEKGSRYYLDGYVANSRVNVENSRIYYSNSELRELIKVSYAGPNNIYDISPNGWTINSVRAHKSLQTQNADIEIVANRELDVKDLSLTQLMSFDLYRTVLGPKDYLLISVLITVIAMLLLVKEHNKWKPGFQ